MPKVSVIVPSYNLGEYLPETLESLLAQTFSDWECIIVENGSVDGSGAIAADFASRDGRFSLIALPSNEGVTSARNRGVLASSGEYILFLDADDLITPDYMARAVAALDQDPSLTLVYGEAERFGAESSWDLPPFSMETMLARNCLYISCFLRRVHFVPFDSSFTAGCEDWDFWLSVLEKVQEPRVLRLEGLCFRYRTRRKSRNAGVSDSDLKTIRRALWEKHKNLYSKYFCNPLETMEYTRLERSFRKASRWSLAWKLRMLYRKLFA